jgi:hypothetical protein
MHLKFGPGIFGKPEQVIRCEGLSRPGNNPSGGKILAPMADVSLCLFGPLPGHDDQLIVFPAFFKGKNPVASWRDSGPGHDTHGLTGPNTAVFHVSCRYFSNQGEGDHVSLPDSGFGNAVSIPG